VADWQLRDLLEQIRTAETPAASTVHHPFGSPSGPGLFHVKGLQLPAYIQNVAHAFRRKGLSESEAIQRAVGVVKDWAAGRAPGGGRVHPDVQAAAIKAVAEWEAAKAAAHGRSVPAAGEFRVGPKSYIHGWIYVGPGGLHQLETERKETGPGIGKVHTSLPVSHLADIIEREGHANFREDSPRIQAVIDELKRRGITAKAEPVTLSGERRVHVYDVAQRRPAGGNHGEVLPVRARKLADRVMANMAEVQQLSDADLRAVERELSSRLAAGQGDAGTLRLRLQAVRARLRQLSSSRSYPERNASMAPEYRAQMTAQSINDLPDSAFAYIEPGGSKDSSGKTVPRSLRHFPVHDAAHVRNALARAPQSPFGEKAMPKIRAAAKKLGVQVSEDSGRSLSAGDTERRYTPGVVEVRAAEEGKRIGGYGAVFGKLSRNLGGFVERVGDGAFNQSRTLGWPNVVCRYNHDSNMVLGTTAGRTLQLRTDGMGLDYEVNPPNARADILELVQRGDVQYSSFAFRVPPGGDEWGVTDQNYPLRTLHEVQLVDVAPVLDPAYPDATAGLRSLAAAMDAPFEDVAGLAAEDELRRFFVRTDNRGPAPKPRVTGAMAMMQLMAKKFPDLDN
jgi:HK97 family phage prohead protease